MFKKIAAIAGAGAMLLSTATPAFAWGYNWGGTMNSAVVTNSANSSANTGWNLQLNEAKGTWAHEVEVEGTANTLYTGAAVSDATAVTAANTQVGGCNICHRSLGFTYNSAVVNNGAASSANTGYNDQVNSASGAGWFGEVEVEHTNNYMGTGPAVSSANAWTVVNTNWSF